MTASAARMEVWNLDKTFEEEKENSKDGTSALMAMAIGQALLKKKKLAVYKDVEQGPAANHPVDDSQSLVQVDESQGRRGAMAGCMSQGGGCNTAFTFASGNRAGNSERALAEVREGDLAEIKSIETEQEKKLAPSATDHTATLDGQQYSSELQSRKKTTEDTETLMESTSPNSTASAPTTVAAPTSALCADTETATTCGLAKQLCYIKEGQGTKDFCTANLLTSCRQALGLCGATSTKTEIQSPTATMKNIALCDGDQGGSLPCSRVEPRWKKGNSEDDEDNLAEIESSAKKKTTKLALDATTKAKEETTKLASDATTKNIALCDGDQGGSLPCSRVKPKANNKPNKPSDCPDDLSKGKFFYQNGIRGNGVCLSLSHIWAIKRLAVSTHKFPGLEGKYVVLTKPSIDHPHKSHKNVVGFFLKRMVCTVDSPITCRTYKVGICAKCHDVAFESKWTNKAWPENKEALAKRFVDKCLLKKKKAYDECEGEDLKHFNDAQSIF